MTPEITLVKTALTCVRTGPVRVWACYSPYHVPAASQGYGVCMMLVTCTSRLRESSHHELPPVLPRHEKHGPTSDHAPRTDTLAACL
jgi:hypothetical protein